MANERCSCPKDATSKTLCDVCWKVAFERLRQEARQEDAREAELIKGIIINPSPEARESCISSETLATLLGARKGKRLLGASHRGDKIHRDSTDDAGGPRASYVIRGPHSKNLALRIEVNHTANLCEWVCPQCGPLNAKYPPLMA